jgi:hypothetical protein
MKKTNNIILTIQINCKNTKNIPKKHFFERWIKRTLYKKKILI